MRTRDEALKLVQALLADGIIGPRDLTRFLPTQSDPCDPEAVRQEWEHWYISMGIETVIGRSFRLEGCPFTAEEIERADREGEMILCVPRGIDRRQLASLFRMSTWALNDPLVGDTTEVEDVWFKTPRSRTPEYLNKSATEARRIMEDQNRLGFSLERYMVFCARYRFLYGTDPDFKYWIWLLRGRYDRSGILIAGFDPMGSFSVHAWVPRFQASFVGVRFAQISSQLADAVPVSRQSAAASAGAIPQLNE